MFQYIIVYACVQHPYYGTRILKNQVCVNMEHNEQNYRFYSTVNLIM